MNITPLNLDLATFAIGSSGSERAAGLHASDIYGSLFKALEPKRFDRGDGPPPPVLLETGLIFENMLEEGLARRFVVGGSSGEQCERPGEFTYEGVFDGAPFAVHYNPDLLIYSLTGTRGGEIKATWLSSKIPHDWIADEDNARIHQEDIALAFLNPKFDKYYCQMKLYGKFLGIKDWRLYVAFIAGDYTRPFRTQIIGVDVDFSEDEIDMNYFVCMNHARSKGMF